MKFTTLFASLLLASVITAGNVSLTDDADQGLTIEEVNDSSDYVLPTNSLLSAGESRSLDRKSHHKELATSLSLEKRYKLYSGGQGTYYYGGQLQNPACNGPTPNDNTMAVAVPVGSPAKCGDTVHLHWQGKTVAAKVVDHCGGCANSYSVDMTKAVFKHLAPLSKGRLYGLKMRVIHH